MFVELCIICSKILNIILNSISKGTASFYNSAANIFIYHTHFDNKSNSVKSLKCLFPWLALRTSYHNRNHLIKLGKYVMRKHSRVGNSRGKEVCKFTSKLVISSPSWVHTLNRNVCRLSYIIFMHHKFHSRRTWPL